MEGTLRLSKLMSELGLASRREADRYIEKGWVLVDGKPVTELGTKVRPTAKVELKAPGKRERDNKLTILLNKPVGYVSCQPEKNYPAAIELVKEPTRDTSFKTKKKLPSYLPKIAVAGRLDINSKGLLVLTQDGRVAKELIQENSELEKEYLVRVSRDPSDSELERLSHGLRLDNRALKPARVERLGPEYLRFVLNEGRRRQIRRMCELVDIKVLSIKRVRIGSIRLGSLKPGHWRFLESNESF